MSFFSRFFNLTLLIFRNIFRNKLRTALTGLSTMILVFIVTLVWSVLSFLDAATAERAARLKGIVTEKWKIPSQMPYAYSADLRGGGATADDQTKPEDYMSWTFYGGSTEKDPAQRTRDSALFFLCTEADKVNTMMEELDELTGSAKDDFDKIVQKLKNTRTGCILGRDRLKALKKGVGDKITIYSLNYRGIDLEFEIVGEFPKGRYDNSAIARIDYINAALEDYERQKGTKHPLAGRSMNLFWFRVPDRLAFDNVTRQLNESSLFTSPAVKVETASGAVNTFLEGYRDILWGARYLLGPAILVTLSLVIANAISISVRERETEFAVMKVLGYRPRQIMFLVLGEALLVGILCGLLSAGLTYFLVNIVGDGLKIPIAFFQAFYIPKAALWWGLAVGAGTSLLGSLVPSWNACRVRVAEIFSRVT